MSANPGHRAPGLGASLTPDGVAFGVWAPHCRQAWVEVQTPVRRVEAMTRHDGGVWRTNVDGLGPGARYTFRLDDDGGLPDPYSRRQPDGVHGPSQVTDPQFAWTDTGWRGCGLKHLVIYECHVGAATPDGTLDALAGELGRLADLGVTAIELMPVAAFAGTRNWGYDGVHAFAVSENYGGPGQLKRFVDAAHGHGLAVLLDVVYNHVGPDGNYLPRFSPHYLSTDHDTPWGASLNFDGELCEHVRQYVIDNACFWLNEYHVDGLRLDATGQVHDRSQPHILSEVTAAARASVAPGRDIVLIAESCENDVRYLESPERGGYGFDAVYADDFYWSLNRYATGERSGRQQDYEGTLVELARTIRQGFLHEGAWSGYEGRRRGTSARSQSAWRLQYCLQHHDHVGNRAFGDRLHHRVGLDWYRAASALLLLLPYTPLLFMGQEFAASSPFLFFTDHRGELGDAIRRGRRREFSAYPEFAGAADIPDPQDEATFLRSRLARGEALGHPGIGIQRLYRELLRLRREDEVLSRLRRDELDVVTPGEDCLALRWRHAGAHRLLTVNFGAARSLRFDSLPGHDTASRWRTLLATSERRFGGAGHGVDLGRTSIQVPARCAALLAAGGAG